MYRVEIFMITADLGDGFALLGTPFSELAVAARSPMNEKHFLMAERSRNQSLGGWNRLRR